MTPLGNPRKRWALALSAFALSFILVWWAYVPGSIDLGKLKTLQRPLHNQPKPAAGASPSQNKVRRDHPIDHLINNATRYVHSLLAKRSFTLAEAAAQYRERRGRHPPPGFDVWFAEAVKLDAIVVEEFFDRIHHDINPLWALSPRDMRVQANTQLQIVRVRNGTAIMVTDDPNRQPWIQHWTALVEEFASSLPDLDMVVNTMDETRILVPWDKMAEYVRAEQDSRKLIDPSLATSTYSGLKDVDEMTGDPYTFDWIRGDANKFWDHLRTSCPPDSPARDVPSLESFDVPIEYPRDPMPYTYKGFVQNVTSSRDPCFQPHLRGMHGTFIESVSMATIHELFPMFAGCKLPQNNEILIPGAMYLTDREFYSGGEDHGAPWSEKKHNSLIWRGTASGGRNKRDNWWHFHRHRFVQMMNGTTVGALEHGDAARGPTFNLVPKERFNISAQARGELGEWVSTWSDVAFNHLECWEGTDEEKKAGHCPYNEHLMAFQPSKPMKEQYLYKYLPDVDGNSYSARWRAFLLSTSVPLKAGIYSEWHDDRIVPWAHFVPFDASYADIYAVMEYFLDDRDDIAETIATEGKAWAEKVYRREDMRLYVWRLLLEYARVVDDKRDNLAFVGDLV